MVKLRHSAGRQHARPSARSSKPRQNEAFPGFGAERSGYEMTVVEHESTQAHLALAGSDDMVVSAKIMPRAIVVRRRVGDLASAEGARDWGLEAGVGVMRASSHTVRSSNSYT